MTIGYDKYIEPRNDLIIEAIQKGNFIDGDIWRTFLDTCSAVQIIAVGFGGITEDNFRRNEIDKYYIFNLYGVNYGIWSYLYMEKEHMEIFPTQIAHPVKKGETTIETWDLEEINYD